MGAAARVHPVSGRPRAKAELGAEEAEGLLALLAGLEEDEGADAEGAEMEGEGEAQAGMEEEAAKEQELRETLKWAEALAYEYPEEEGTWEEGAVQEGTGEGAEQEEWEEEWEAAEPRDRPVPPPARSPSKRVDGETRRPLRPNPSLGQSPEARRPGAIATSGEWSSPAIGAW